MNAIEVEGLEKVFPGDVRAVAGIDLEVREGEIYGFLGPNGAGKSTTIRILTTLLRPTGGRARLGGLDLGTEAHRVRHVIGPALQEAGLTYNRVHGLREVGIPAHGTVPYVPDMARNGAGRVRVQRKTRLKEEPAAPLPFDPRDPDVVRAKKGRREAASGPVR